MIKMVCSNEKCKHIWFDEMHNLCPKCSSKAKILSKEEKKIEDVIKNKKPHIR